MKIAIVGPEVSTSRVVAVVQKKEPFIECIGAPYQDLSEVPQIVRKYQPIVDGLLFTGQTPFQYACYYVNPEKPWEYLPRNMISTLCALLRAGYLNNYDIRKISEDGFFDNTLLQVYDEIGFSRKEIHIYSCPINVSEPNYCKKVAEFHSDLYLSNKISLCLTGNFTVEHILKERNIPVVRCAINTESIMDRVSQLRLVHETGPTEEYRIAVVIVATSFLREHSLNSRSELQLLQQENRSREIIYTMAGQLNAALVDKSQTYYLFTTQLQIARETHNFKNIPVLTKLQAIDQSASISIGIGLGATPSQAKRNAEIGLKKAARYGSAGFVIYENGQMIGPITENSSDSQIPLLDRNLYLISQKTSIGIDTLSLIDHVQRQFDLNETTPSELARLCGFTLRSMNRFLQRLIDAGYAVVVGKESSQNPGRPKRIIRLRLTERK